MLLGRAIAITFSLYALSNAAETNPLKGIWHVSATDMADCTCTGTTPGEIHEYTWRVEPVGDVSVHVDVQGETGFPRLFGIWNAKTRTLVLNGYYTENSGACWFKLNLQKDGTFKGVRRYIGREESPDHRPCFVDYAVSGKRLSTVLEK